MSHLPLDDIASLVALLRAGGLDEATIEDAAQRLQHEAEVAGPVPAPTASCPTITRFLASMEGEWTDSERAHVAGCLFCQFRLAGHWAKRCPPWYVIGRYAETPALEPDRLAVALHLGSDQCVSCHEIMLEHRPSSTSVDVSATPEAAQGPTIAGAGEGGGRDVAEARVRDSHDVAADVPNVIQMSDRTRVSPGAVMSLRQPNWRVLSVAAALTIALGGGYLVLQQAWRRPTADPVGGGAGAGEPASETTVTLAWPSVLPIDPGNRPPWARRPWQLPSQAPDFGRSTGTLGRSGGDARTLDWRRATVIIRTAEGYGSGARISPDGWILTNYHVVEDAVRAASLNGRPATVTVIPGVVDQGRLKPGTSIDGIVYRVDAVRDLALVRATSLPPSASLSLAKEMPQGGDAYVIGSQGGGFAWWLRRALISQVAQFPDDLSQFAAGVGRRSALVDRTRATVIVTDASISGGDSGGPLLNANGQVIGLTFATPNNRSSGSVGWHVALPHLREIVSTWPQQPEGAPFDAWTAGLGDATLLQPELMDRDGDGALDSLWYIFAQAREGQEPQPVAMTVFVDFQQRSTASSEADALLPKGLWGLEGGRFRFDVFVTIRTDGILAVGHTSAAGVVDEVRVQATEGRVLWRRAPSGVWQASPLAAEGSLVNTGRLSAANLRRLTAILPSEEGNAQTPSPGRNEKGPGRAGPNKVEP